jgi:hypothetical protein
LSEAPLLYTVTWWLALIVSLVLMLREMRKWLLSRTATVEPLSDSLKFEPMGDEVEEVAKWLKSLSKQKTGFFTIGLRVSDALVDRLCLSLELERDELFNLLRDEESAKKTLGADSSFVDNMVGGWMGGPSSTKNEKRSRTGQISRNKRFDEIITLLDQAKRWEIKHESKRGV